MSQATVDFECTDDGVIAKILVPAGAQDVAVGTVSIVACTHRAFSSCVTCRSCTQPLVVIVDDEEDVAAFADYSPDGKLCPASNLWFELGRSPWSASFDTVPPSRPASQARLLHLQPRHPQLMPLLLRPPRLHPLQLPLL